MATKICNINLSSILKDMKEIDLTKRLSDIVIFDGASNVQFAGRPLKVCYTKLTGMRDIEHTVSLFSMIFIKHPFYIRCFLPTR